MCHWRLRKERDSDRNSSPALTRAIIALLLARQAAAMTLGEALVFDKAVITSLKVEPGEEEPRLALSFRASFSAQQARTLCCEDLLFNAEGQPRHGWESIPLECELERVTADFKPPIEQIVPLQITPIALERFKVVRIDSGLVLSFRMVIGGRARELCDFVTQMGKGSFRLEVEPTQMALFSNEQQIHHTAPLEVPAAETLPNIVPPAELPSKSGKEKGIAKSNHDRRRAGGAVDRKTSRTKTSRSGAQPVRRGR